LPTNGKYCVSHGQQIKLFAEGKLVETKPKIVIFLKIYLSHLLKNLVPELHIFLLSAQLSLRNSKRIGWKNAPRCCGEVTPSARSFEGMRSI